MKKVAAKIVAVILCILLISGGSVVAYVKFVQKPKFKKAYAAEKLKGEVLVGDLAYNVAHPTAKLYGYENEWSFPYKLDQSPVFLRAQKDDNWLTGGLKSFGKAFLGKEYEINLSCYFMLGYDLSTMKKSDFVYNKKDKVLTIHLPNLEMIYTPDYGISEFKSMIGYFRLPFTEEERKEMYVDSLRVGALTFRSDEKDEIRKGHDLTQSAFKDLLLKTPDIEKNVKQIIFVEQPGVDISIEKYKKQTKNN